MTFKLGSFGMLLFGLTLLIASGESHAASAPTVSITADPYFVTAGEQSRITWSSTNATNCSGAGNWTGDKPLSDSKNTGKLSKSETFTLTCTGPGGSASNSVTVAVTGGATLSGATTAAPSVSLRASPATVTAGGKTVVIWKSSNATACTGSGAWSGSKLLKGSATTGQLTKSVTWELTCTGAGGSTSKSATATVAAAPLPIVTISANPTTVKAGGKTVVSWSSSNATACTGTGAWSGSKLLKGAATTGDLSKSLTWDLTCTGAGGSASKSVSVTVDAAPAPTVTISANPKTITAGKTTVVSWSSTNATACTGTGAWTGSKLLKGAATTGELTKDLTWALTCTGAGGRATESATVSVAAVPVSGDATLSWAAPTTNTNGTPVSPLTGYHLYYGNSPSALTKSIAISGGASTTYEITGLTAGTWYFAVAADATDGTESPKSAVGSKTI